MIWNLAWIAGTPDADNFYSPLYSRNIGLSNDARLRSPDYDKAYEAMRALPEGPERAVQYRRMNEIITAYAPWILDSLQLPEPARAAVGQGAQAASVPARPLHVLRRRADAMPRQFPGLTITRASDGAPTRVAGRLRLSRNRGGIPRSGRPRRGRQRPAPPRTCCHRCFPVRACVVPADLVPCVSKRSASGATNVHACSPVLRGTAFVDLHALRRNDHRQRFVRAGPNGPALRRRAIARDFAAASAPIFVPIAAPTSVDVR